MKRFVRSTTRSIGLPYIIIGILAILLIIAWSQGAFSSFRYPYLIPWIIITASVVVSPVAYLIVHHRFELFHPLVYASWSYFFPAFVIGGLILAAGYNEPYFTSFIGDPEMLYPSLWHM